MNKPWLRISILLCCVSFLGMCILYPTLPASVPVHWNFHWQPDAWGAKSSLFFYAALPFLVPVASAVLPQAKRGTQQNPRAYSLMLMVTTLLLISMNWVSILAVLQTGFSAQRLLPLVIGLALLVLGNYTPQLRHNNHVGIRTPWTLANETVWRKTHRIGGFVLCGVGLAVTLTAFVQAGWFTAGVAALTVGGLVGLVVYSFVLYQKLGRG